MKKTFGILCAGLLVTAVAVANDSTVSAKNTASGVAYNDKNFAVNKVAKHDPIEIALLALKVLEQNGQLNQASLDKILSAVELSFPSVMAQAEVLNVEGGNWQEMLKISAILSSYSALDDLDGIKLFDANEKSQLGYLSSQLIDSVILQNEDFRTETFQDEPSNTELLVRLLVGSHEVTGDLLSNLTIENGLNALLKDYFTEGYQPFDIWEEIKLLQAEPSAMGYEDWIELADFKFGLAKSDLNAHTLGTSSLSAPKFTVTKDNNKLTYEFNWDYKDLNPEYCRIKIKGKKTLNGKEEVLYRKSGPRGEYSLEATFNPYISEMISTPLITESNVLCYSEDSEYEEDFSYVSSRGTEKCPDIPNYSLGVSEKYRTKQAYYFSSSLPFYQTACTSGTAVSWKDITPAKSYRDSGAIRYYYRTLVKPDLSHKQYLERKVYFRRVGMRQGGVGNDGLFGKKRACYASYSIYVQRYDLNGKAVGSVTKAYGPIEIKTGTQKWGRTSPKENCAADHYVITRSKTDAKYWNWAKDAPARYVR